jgi:hypothetical protein
VGCHECRLTLATSRYVGGAQRYPVGQPVAAEAAEADTGYGNV